NQKTLLFGGWADELGLMADTWIYDSQTNQWTELSPLDHPSERQSFAMYYDSDAQRVILFGGYRDVSPHHSDMWEYNYTDNTWTDISPLIHPSGRYGSNMVYDPDNGRGFLFAGRSSSIRDDTWVYYYANKSWSEITTSSTPDDRYWHGLIYNPNNQKMMVFGGRHLGAPGEALDDTWTFDLLTNEWTEVLPTIHPSNRMDFSMIYDSNRQQVILFGGFRFPESTLGDTWRYDITSSSWSLVKNS
ncbi:MAG: Kelch repeat-containing protein, partial [Promethearchaeota archaeon]